MKMMPITGDQFDILVEQGADLGAFFENAPIPDHIEDSPEALLDFIASEHHEVGEPVVRQIDPAIDRAVFLTTGDLNKKAKHRQGFFMLSNSKKPRKIPNKIKKNRYSNELYLEAALSGYNYSLSGKFSKK